MTNTQQMMIGQTTAFAKGNNPMQGWTDSNQVVIRARIQDRIAEAASERLAAASRATSSNSGVRQRVGHLLIVAGRHVAGEPVPTGSPAVRPSHRMAA